MVTFTVALRNVEILSFHLVSAQLGVLTGGKNSPQIFCFGFKLFTKIQYVDHQKANRFESDFSMSGASRIATLKIDSDRNFLGKTTSSVDSFQNSMYFGIFFSSC